MGTTTDGGINDGACSLGVSAGTSFLGSRFSKQIWQKDEPPEFSKPHLGHFMLFLPGRKIK
ncbi:MAG: hypothetical protein A2297_04145 [Elusimicrobia bacterium RIFOXYB2_FULL_48_7]|nr:MAG: hypothetical protein A2297_04145 [Elusimicrobia bacterium RIFOXYB2_FULL_48_7]